MFIFSFLFTGENGKTIMKPVYLLRRKNKIGKSKIDIDFQFLILNSKLNGRMTHGPNHKPLEAIVKRSLALAPRRLQSML